MAMKQNNKETCTLADIEKYRINAIIWGLVMIATIVLLLISFFVQEMAFFFVMFILVVVIFIFSSSQSKFKKAFKHYFIAQQFESALGVPVDVELNGYSVEYIKDSHLIPTSNTFSSDDLISFDYAGIKVRRGDVHTEQVTSTGKSTTRVTLFKGQYMTFTFPKTITSFMVIKDNAFFDDKPDGFFSSAPKTTKVEFESIEFNKMFDTFAADEHEAFYLVTPQFMQLLMDFRVRQGCKVYYGFMRNEFHIAIDTRENMFEPSLLQKVDESSGAIDSNHIHEIVNMINHFRLVEDEG
ncbi:MAG: DUF3137 domain-containing protein [Erysipelotrichaceae bacterium]|uniref:DUF3137 domain-containing protein n=2 Tax=Anaerorhabdus sp. TaxID=1872524 RepID=UPI002FC62C6D